MNNKIILVCGLPGSGKTFLGRNLSQEMGFEFIDDITKESFPRFHELLSNNQSVIISDPKFTHTKIRNEAIKYLKQFEGLTIEWIFFENDPKQCVRNINVRDDGRDVVDFVKSFSRLYKIPDSAKTIPVFR